MLFTTGELRTRENAHGSQYPAQLHVEMPPRSLVSGESSAQLGEDGYHLGASTVALKPQDCMGKTGARERQRFRDKTAKSLKEMARQREQLLEEL